MKKQKTYDAWGRREGDANTGTPGTVTDVAIHSRKRKILNTVLTDRSVRSAPLQ